MTDVLTDPEYAERALLHNIHPSEWVNLVPRRDTTWLFWVAAMEAF